MKITYRQACSLWMYMVKENSKCHSAMSLLGIRVNPDRRRSVENRASGEFLVAMGQAMIEYADHQAEPAPSAEPVKAGDEPGDF